MLLPNVTLLQIHFSVLFNAGCCQYLVLFTQEWTVSLVFVPQFFNFSFVIDKKKKKCPDGPYGGYLKSNHLGS